jgi:hypothetical protein
VQGLMHVESCNVGLESTDDSCCVLFKYLILCWFCYPKTETSFINRGPSVQAFMSGLRQRPVSKILFMNPLWRRV